jgi:hypothetical protein
MRLFVIWLFVIATLGPVLVNSLLEPQAVVAQSDAASATTNAVYNTSAGPVWAISKCWASKVSPAAH